MGDGRRALIALAAAAVFGDAARAGEDAATVLHRAVAKVLSSLKGGRDYTCVETVTRRFYQPLVVTLPRACNLVRRQTDPKPLDALHLFSTDRLRLDVTMTHAGETYSWPGASKFEEGGLTAVVRRGPIGSGAFAGFLTAIFGTDAKKFDYLGQETWNGRDVMRFGFAIPLADSHYRMRMDGAWLTIAYAGEFLVDETNFDLVELKVTADDLPEAAKSCASSTTLTFGGHDQPLLLPTSARQSNLYPTGEQSVNATEFANCREYRGESVIRYGEGDDAGGTRGAKAAEAALVPPGLRFSTVLLDAIDSTTAAAGDPFRARLVEDLRAGRRLIARKGSVVEGRLRRVEVLAKAKQVAVVMAPVAIFTGSDRVSLQANRVVMPRKGVVIRLPERQELPAGLFEFAGGHVVVAAGFRSDWVTAIPAR